MKNFEDNCSLETSKMTPLKHNSDEMNGCYNCLNIRGGKKFIRRHLGVGCTQARWWQQV